MQNGDRRNEDDFDKVRVLMDLGALDRSDLLKNGAIDAVILTEDASAVDRHPRAAVNPLRKLLVANGANLSLVQVWSYEGCTKNHAAKVLARFIAEHAPRTRVLIHMDRDYLSDHEINAFRTNFGCEGVSIFVTCGTDVESHFLDPRHLSLAAHIPEHSAADVLNAATAEVRGASLDALSRAEMTRERARRRNEEKSGDPSPAQVADTCARLFDSDPARYRHGKRTLKACRRIVNERFGTQPDLLEVSPYLETAELTEFFRPKPVRKAHHSSWVSVALTLPGLSSCSDALDGTEEDP